MFSSASFGPRRRTGGPVGAEGVALTPGRSLAVDAAYHALGTPIFVTAPELATPEAGKPFRRLMIAQDVGSAIRGPERGDIFWGLRRGGGGHRREHAPCGTVPSSLLPKR